MAAMMLIIFCFPMSLPAQSNDQMKFHAVFIYNFYREIEWPEAYRNQNFVITVLGQTPLIQQLNTVFGNRAPGNYRFEVKVINSVSELGPCHMLFVAKEKSGDFNAIRQKLSGRSTLLMTDSPGLGGNGSCINFVQVNDMIKFEMNMTAMRQAGLVVSSTLKSLAIIIGQ